MTTPTNAPPGALSATDWTVVGFMVILTGTTFPVLSFALEYLPPLWVALFRMAFAFPVIVVAALLIGRGTEPLSNRDRLKALGLGVPSLGVYCALAIVGLSTVPPGLATVLACTIPLFVVLYALAAGSKVPGSKIAAIGAGFVGVIVVSLGGGQIGGGRLLGIVFLLAAAACFALGAFLQRRWFHPSQFIRLDAWQFVGALIALLVASVLFQPIPPSTLAVSGPWLPLAWCILSTGVAYAMWFWLLTRGTTSSVASTILLSPIVAIVLSLFWFGEQISIIELVGIVVILVALFEVNRADHPRTHPHPRPTP